MYKIYCIDCNTNLDADKDLIIRRNETGEDILQCPKCGSIRFERGWFFKCTMSYNTVDVGNYNNGDYDDEN